MKSIREGWKSRSLALPSKEMSVLHPTNCFLKERCKKHVTSIRKGLSVESVMFGYVRELAPVTLFPVLRLSNDRSIHPPSTSG